MPKLTDYVREGYRRRQRPWDRTELPEWWDVAIWVAVACIALMLVVSAVLARDDPPATSNADGSPPAYPAETLNPRELGASPGSGSTPPSGAANSSTPPVELSPESFRATNAVRVSMTGGGTTVVPAGARNVAMAAARAAATGDWSGIPFIGTARPPANRAPTPQGSVVGQVTVADPTVTGNSQYRFSAQITHGGNAKPQDLKFPVERDGSGYAVRVG